VLTTDSDVGNGGGGEGFPHVRVERIPVDVAGPGQAAPFVGGVGDPAERFGGVGAGGEHADVIDDDQVPAADPGDAGVGSGLGDEGAAVVLGNQLRPSANTPQNAISASVCWGDSRCGPLTMGPCHGG
jgi:hypothetical protein